MANFWARFSAPLPACKPNNASALFGPGPSFTGLTAVDLNYAREWRAPPKKKEPRKIRRSNSDLAVRRKSVEKRKSRDLNKELSESSNTHVVSGGCHANGLSKEKPSRPKSGLSETSQNRGGHVSRYPLFIPVDGSQAQAKPRGEKQIAGRKSSCPCPSPNQQSSSPAQRIRPPRRSASFSSPRKPSASEENSGPRGTGNQPKIRRGVRREKIDIVHRGSGTSRTGSEISKQTRSYSSASLNRKNSGVVSPRLQARASPRRGSDSSFGFRREKSDVVRTRRAPQTPSPTNSRQQVVHSKGSPQSLRCRSSSKVSDTSSNSGSEMSKIPSLKRRPVATGKSQAQISRIPSLTRQQHAPIEHARTPPKSKIPSISKADKRSQIPSGSQKSQDSSAVIPSRIPSFSNSQGRPGSAKENQDPSIAVDDGPEQSKDEVSSEPKTRIPSSQNPRIPPPSRKDSDADMPDDVEDGVQNGAAECVVNGGTELPKVKKSSVSRIPSFTRPSAPKEEPKPKSNITSPASATAPKVPSSSASKISEPKPVENVRPVPTSLSIASKPSGIPKPGGVQSPSGIPKPNGIQSPVTQSTSGIPTPGSKVSSLPQVQSRLPQLSRKESNGNAPLSKLPSFSGATATKKTSGTEKARDAGKKDAEPSKTSPENLQESEDSPTHKCIAYEAQKVEQLLREEQVVVEVPVEVQAEDEAEIEEETPEDSTEKPEVPTQDEKLISDVLESYAPELANKENVPILENQILGTAGNQSSEGRLSLDDIYVQAFENEMAKATRGGSRGPADNFETAQSKKEESECKKSVTQTQEAEPRTPDDEKKSAEVQALDTLGGYEQQSRRTRSRQRKMVSDTEESENEQSVSKEPKKGIDKDKYGNSPVDAEMKTKENAKPTKSKSKNEKSKFVVESSLGKEFYESKKTESKESISGLPTVNKPEETSVIIENTTAKAIASTPPAVQTDEAAEFEDIDLKSIEEHREISRSVDELDEKTVKCMGCGRGGKCSIM